MKRTSFLLWSFGLFVCLTSSTWSQASSQRPFSVGLDLRAIPPKDFRQFQMIPLQRKMLVRLIQAHFAVVGPGVGADIQVRLLSEETFLVAEISGANKRLRRKIPHASQTMAQYHLEVIHKVLEATREIRVKLEQKRDSVGFSGSSRANPAPRKRGGQKPIGTSQKRSMTRTGTKTPKKSTPPAPKASKKSTPPAPKTRNPLRETPSTNLTRKVVERMNPVPATTKPRTKIEPTKQKATPQTTDPQNKARSDNPIEKAPSVKPRLRQPSSPKPRTKGKGKRPSKESRLAKASKNPEVRTAPTPKPRARARNVAPKSNEKVRGVVPVAPVIPNPWRFELGASAFGLFRGQGVDFQGSIHARWGQTRGLGVVGLVFVAPSSADFLNVLEWGAQLGLSWRWELNSVLSLEVGALAGFLQHTFTFEKGEPKDGTELDFLGSLFFWGNWHWGEHVGARLWLAGGLASRGRLHRWNQAPIWERSFGRVELGLALFLRF